MQKICAKCGEQKPVDAYYSYPGEEKKDGSRTKRIKNTCKQCLVESAKKWVEQNKEKRKEIKRRWSLNNKKHLRNYYQEYLKKNPDLLKQWRKNADSKKSESLTDAYVMKCLLSGTSLTSRDLAQYPELIQIQRLIIKTKRLCKTSQN